MQVFVHRTLSRVSPSTRQRAGQLSQRLHWHQCCSLQPSRLTLQVPCRGSWRGFAAYSNSEEPGTGEVSVSSTASYGSRFLHEAKEVERRMEEVKTASSGAGKLSSIQQDTLDPEVQTREQLKRLFKDVPSRMSWSTAHFLHKKGKLEPKVHPALDEQEFKELFLDERRLHRNRRRSDVRRRRSRRRNYFQLNEGYTEEDEVYEAMEEEFTAEWRSHSIAEDCWKAEHYVHVLRTAEATIPEREPLAVRTDRVADVLAGALRKHVAEQNRPVLTHELADYDNAYMMKRSALHRLLQERCVRNQLDERCLPRLLDRRPELMKLRSKANLPPETLEPLAAFRGDVRWHFDAQERLTQKLDAVDSALGAVVSSSGDTSAVTAALPENAKVDTQQVSGVQHPWRNHLGFDSAVPRGVAGGTHMGRPMNKVDEQILRLRYPTLQRVAHTLPKDPKWRAHVARTINVLERQKHWDYRSKLRAVNSMKEVYDSLPPSDEYTAALDEKLPANRVPSHLKRKYARDVQYIKSYPRKFMKKKTHERYRASLTATAPLGKRK